MNKYTNDGKKFYYEGEGITHNGKRYCCVTASWLMAHGYMPYKSIEEDGEDGIVDGCYVHYLGAPYVAPEPEPYVPTEEELAAQAEAERIANINYQIEQLKQQLADSDYKVIKNYESETCGSQYEYDPAELHAERQALRDQINALQEELNPTEEEEAEDGTETSDTETA